VVIEQLLNMSVGLVDTYIVGHLGAAPLAAVGLSMQALSLFWALFAAIGVGSTALVSRHVGAQEPDQANAIARQSVLLALFVGALGSGTLWAGAPLFLTWLGAEADVIALGISYIRAVASTVFLFSVLWVGSAVLRGAGDTRTPMLLMLVVNVVNIIVTYALVHGLGPLPRLGVLGSGIGAASARGIGGLVMLWLLMRGRGPIRIGFGIPRPDWSGIGRILRIGLPTAGEQMLMRFGQVVLAAVITGLGTVAYAAHQVAINALSVAYMPGFGFALAATTLVGQELGAKRPDRAHQCAHEAVRLATLVMAVMGVLVSLFASQVMRIAGLVMPLLGVGFTFAGGLRGAGDTTAVLVVLGASIWCVRVAGAYLLSPSLGLIGIWIAIGLDFGVRSTLLALRFRSGKWKSIRV
jgi:putative MATE family efflux protein